jgi:hypothetical protein
VAVSGRDWNDCGAEDDTWLPRCSWQAAAVRAESTNTSVACLVILPGASGLGERIALAVRECRSIGARYTRTEQAKAETAMQHGLKRN